jgi:hypothetical protein
MQASLKSRISLEHQEIEVLTELLGKHVSTEKLKVPVEKMISSSDAEMPTIIQLVNENQLLEVNQTILSCEEVSFYYLQFIVITKLFII